MDSVTKCENWTERDFDVDAEFLQEGLGWCFEAKAFSGRQVVGQQDFLKLLVGDGVDIERSETARRNTNLFHGVIRVTDDSVPFAEHLIHRTEKGHLVRPKSELVIANMLFQLGIPYEYERVCDGTAAPGRLRPDFSFVTADGDLIIWEHLGMLSRPDYRRGWEWKSEWYKANGYVDGKTLFTSTEDNENGLDSSRLKETALTIKGLLT